MNSTIASPRARKRAIETVAHTLPQRSALLGRLFAQRARYEISRTEASVLSTLSRGPRRITELADLERLAQPTITQLVKRLEERGWVARRRDDADGRAVLVAITGDGLAAVDAIRARLQAVLRDSLAGMSDEQVAALLAAGEALQTLIDALHDGEER
jgi:DNA-binding MarR family transcriptional regulator